MKIIDISRPLSAETAIWPGDIPFILETNLSRALGDPVNLSTIRTSPHIGTHVDAPRHIRDDGAAIDEMDLEPFLGPARVLEVTPDEQGRIGPQAFGSIDVADPPRLLLQASRTNDPNQWDPAFPHLTVEAADHLVRGGAILVGIDSPGVDASDSISLPVHNRLAEAGIRWIENLDLREAVPGIYELIALPLPIRGGDGSPVRAILVER